MDTATPHTPGETTATPEGQPPQPRSKLIDRVQAFRKKYPYREIAAVFSAGFIFDMVTLGRIDSPLFLAQQAAYLLILGGVILYAIRVELGLATPGPRLAKAWTLAGQDVIHFFLGSLLSTFSIFYFKAASDLSAFIFMAVMFGVLIANELPMFRRLGDVARMALYGLSVSTFLSVVVALLFGFLAWWVFVLSLLLSGAICYGLFRLVERWTDRPRALRRVVAPFGGVLVLLAGLYFFRIIPPIPLAITKMGIYHEVKPVKDDKGGRSYRLTHQRPWWKFWHKGDQLFHARPDDSMYVFAAVFAPSGFKDKIQIRWEYDDGKRGWVSAGTTGYKDLVGGTDRGYRTFGLVKQPRVGDYRAFVETVDGRVVGKISATVVAANATEIRNQYEEVY